ncbi:MAG: VWD domain-containing protein [Nakamurella sp.]
MASTASTGTSASAAAHGTPPVAAPASAAATADLPKLPNVTLPAPAPRNTQTAALEQAIDVTGEPTLQQAIDVFSLTMATLPGASTSTLPTGDGFSPSIALNTIRPLRPQLTAAQRAVVDSFSTTPTVRFDTDGHQLSGPAIPDAGPALTVQTGEAPTSPTGSDTSPPAASTGGPAPATAHPASFVVDRLIGASTPPADVTPDPEAVIRVERAFRQVFYRGWKIYQPELFGNLKLDIVVDTKNPKHSQLADLVAAGSSSGTCLIDLFPQAITFYSSFPDEGLLYNAAEETFGCLMYARNTHVSYLPPWLYDGATVFAALDLLRHQFSGQYDSAEKNWFDSPGLPLDDVISASWPLYEAYAEQFHTSAYPVIMQMVDAVPSSTAALVSAGGLDNPLFASLWTTTALEQPSWGPDWTVGWPGTAPPLVFGAPATATEHGVGTYQVTGLGDFSHEALEVPMDSSVGLVGVVPSGGPMATRADSGTVTIGEGEQQWFCVKSGGCICPPGESAMIDAAPLTPPMVFAFNAQLQPTTAAVIARQWDPNTECLEQPQPARGGSALGGWPSGSANGDPHMITLNGLHYDFMTLGEYLTSQDPQGGFIVQERHQAVGFGTAVSAVALGTGTDSAQHRVTITAAEIGSDVPITVRLDGAVTTAPSFTVGPIAVTQSDGELDAVWPDGSTVAAQWRDGFFVTEVLAPSRAARVTGLLGHSASNFLTDLTMPDGTRADPANHYRAFADAWLVTDQTSLFDYEPGQNTASFRKYVALPQPDAPTPQTLALCQRTLGQGATHVEIRDCGYDITSTGQTSYAQAYQQVSAQRQSQIVGDPRTAAPPMIVVGSRIGLPGSSATSNTASPSSTTDAHQGSVTFTATDGGSTPDYGSNPGRYPALSMVAGTVAIATTQCPADKKINVWLNVFLDRTPTEAGPGILLGVCGDLWNSEVYDSDSNGEVHDGEDYALVRQSGTYSVRMETDSPTPVTMAFTVVSDLTPVELAPGALSATGYSTTLSGRADTLVVEVTAPKAGTLTITGGKSVCGKEYYIDTLETGKSGLSDLGGVCWHQDTITLGYSTDPQLVMIFSRDGATAPITVKLTP